MDPRSLGRHPPRAGALAVLGHLLFFAIVNARWVESRLAERAAALANGMHHLPPKLFPRLACEMAVDLHPIEHVLEQAAALADLERKLAAWAGDAPIERYDPSRHGPILGRELAIWSKTAEDRDCPRSPQIAATRELMDAASGVEILLWDWLCTRFPERYFALRGGALCGLSLDPEKGVGLHFEHARSSAAERADVIRRVSEVAAALKTFLLAGGRTLSPEAGGKAHFAFMLSFAAEKAGPENVGALGTLAPPPVAKAVMAS